jgi:hypothetical protein
MDDGFGEGGWIGPSNPGENATVYDEVFRQTLDEIHAETMTDIQMDKNTIREAFLNYRNYLFAGVEGRLPPLLPDPDVVDGELIDE